MKAGTIDSMKFKRLMRRLGEGIRGTAGLLEVLWQRACRDCPRGDIGQFTNEEIAIMADYDGDADALIAAMVEISWLDEHPQHRLLIHDWHEHAPNYVKGVVARTGGFLTQPTDSTAEVSQEPKVGDPRSTTENGDPAADSRKRSPQPKVSDPEPATQTNSRSTPRSKPPTKPPLGPQPKVSDPEPATLGSTPPSLAKPINIPPPPTPASTGSKWAAVEELLLSHGVARAAEACRIAQDAGCGVVHVLNVIELYRAQRPRYGPGALFERVTLLRPGQDAGSLWPEPSVEAKRAESDASRAEKLKQQLAKREANARERERIAAEYAANPISPLAEFEAATRAAGAGELPL